MVIFYIKHITNPVTLVKKDVEQEDEVAQFDSNRGIRSTIAN
jgi:hypothetical protein